MDVFGNPVAWFQLDVPHERLIVEAHALVTVSRPGLTDDDAIPRQGLDDPHLVDQFAEFLLPSPFGVVGARTSRDSPIDAQPRRARSILDDVAARRRTGGQRQITISRA